MLQGLRIAIVLTSRYWCLSVLGPIRYLFRGIGVHCRVCMLSFTGMGVGRWRFSSWALGMGWIGCIVVDLGHVEGINRGC